MRPIVTDRVAWSVGPVTATGQLADAVGNAIVLVVSFNYVIMWTENNVKITSLICLLL